MISDNAVSHGERSYFIDVWNVDPKIHHSFRADRFRNVGEREAEFRYCFGGNRCFRDEICRAYLNDKRYYDY